MESAVTIGLDLGKSFFRYTALMLEVRLSFNVG
jgi:hypothetical protein